MEMAYSKVLFNDVTKFGDFLISIDFIFSQFRSGRIFSHNTVSDFVESKKVAIRFSGISFVRKHFIDRLLGMAAECGAIGEIVGIIYRSRRESSSQDKAMVNVNGGVLFKAKVGDIIFDSPV